MVNNFIIPNIRLFVFGPLRKGGNIDFFMEGGTPFGLYYTEGQLMRTPSGTYYIDFDKKNVATVGELYHVNYYCLQRINYMSELPQEFPKSYELDITPVWLYEDEQKEFTFDTARSTLALTFRISLRDKAVGNDWSKNKNIFKEIGRYLQAEKEKTVYYHDLITHLSDYFVE